jgi:hypothetical protein
VHIRDTIKYSDYKRFGSTTKIIYDGQDISTPQTQTQPQPPTQPQTQKPPQR